MSAGATAPLAPPARTYPLLARGFWRGYWVTLRPYLFFVSGSSGLVGLALGEPLAPVLLGGAVAAFSLSYGLGQALTDVFQTDTDALSSPYRPLVRGELSRGAVLAVSLLGLLACIALFAALSPATLLLGAAGLLGLLSYTPAKRLYWAGPFWNAWIVALLPAMGLLCASASASAALTRPGLTWALLSTLLSYSVFVILGSFKDVEADRATGYRTLPVRFGRRTSVGVSAIAGLAGVACSAELLRASGACFSWAPGLIAWGAGASLLLLAHLRILPTLRDQEAHPAIAMVVRGYVLLRLGEAALVRGGLALPCLALYLLFELTLRRRPCREQI